jgi:hypothetical protein
MTLRSIFLVVIATFTALLFIAAAARGDDDAPKITPEKLKEKLDQPGLYLVDARIASDWKKSDRKIVGAVREDPHDVSAWAKKLPKNKFIVVYCS